MREHGQCPHIHIDDAQLSVGLPLGKIAVQSVAGIVDQRINGNTVAHHRVDRLLDSRMRAQVGLDDRHAYSVSR